ncbi:MAG TPA: TonB family protein [Vicinamibacteria bacterium]|nr:TonB family protein [Vicinamibacteria bacterium]
MDDNSRSTEQMPQSIGRYKVQESIGFGAMGAVYKAFDPLIKRTLAIKTIRLDIPRQSPQYKSFIERFYHEARISGTLSHPNIVTLFDIGEEGGVPYLAMEFVEGQTLASLIEKGVRFKPEKVIGLASQIASAVDYAHSKGVIHRDIKPSNLILFDEDRVKVTDFGIAKLVDAEMTQSGTLLGTPSYMSPEQAMGDKLDGRSDIFSLGVCCFEMLSGEQPFPGNNVTSILYKLVHVDPIEPANLEMHGLVPQKWHEVFGKALAKKPDDRYQTAGAFVQDLEYCLGSWFGGLGADQTIVTASATVETTTTLAHIPLPEIQPPAPPPAHPREEPAATRAPAPPKAKPVERPLAPLPMAEDDSPATVLIKAQPSGSDAPATVLMKAPTAPPPAKKRPSAPAPPPAETDDSPATVLIKAPPADDAPATVLMKAGALPKKPAARPSPPPPLGSEASESTILMDASVPAEEGATVVMAAPGPTAKSRGPADKGGPTQKHPVLEETRSLGRTAAPPLPRPTAPPLPEAPPVAGPPAVRSRIPVGLILGGAALLFLLALGLVGIVLFRSAGRTEPAPPVPTPSVAVTRKTLPTPEPMPPAIEEKKGMIRVVSQPGAAAVTVNGQARGETPLDLRDLPLGSYEVKVELKGYEPKTQTVVLSPELPAAEAVIPLTRSAPATSVADILSTPYGALVSIDGARVGPTPQTDLKLRVGSRRVEMTKDGYEPWAGTLTVQAGKRGKLDAQLKALVKAPPPPAADVVDTAHIYANAASDVDTLAKKLSGLSVSYPESAPKMKSGDSVSVSVSFVVTENGEVTEPRVLESGGNRAVDEAVLAAIRSWKYAPAMKKGIKVKARVTLKQTFRAG